MVFYRKLEDENDLYFDEEKQESIAAAYMPFVEQQRGIDQFSTLYSFKGPFELLHADIAHIRFLASLAVNPKYCLIFVDLFTSKIYMYPMKKSVLKKK